MSKKTAKPKAPKTVETIKHDEATRKNIPTAEFQPVLEKKEQTLVRVAYERRNRDLDPQLVWRGKDDQDWSDLVVHAPPIYIQEKVHPKVLIDDLLRETKERKDTGWRPPQFDLFADFNGTPKGADKTDFYQHDQNWSNRMILGDSLQVMASLAEREGLRGKVQCIYIDPPYGIKFNSNFQWSTTSRDVKDGDISQITREPEQVRAYRDTWRDGIHSYLTYLRDRLTVARDLLTDSGSVFLQIGDENVHHVRELLTEIFGATGCVSTINFATTSAFLTNGLSNSCDYLLWFCRDVAINKYRPLWKTKALGAEKAGKYVYWDDDFGRRSTLTREEKDDPSRIPEGREIYAIDNLSSQGWGANTSGSFVFEAAEYNVGSNAHWKTTKDGLNNLAKAGRLVPLGRALMYKRRLSDFSVFPTNNQWTDTASGASQADPKVYVVQTRRAIVERCILMATDPGDLVLDPTCGSGTSATVAEHWGRRWITIDTSRVALALARARIMGTRYPYYLLADSIDGQTKESEITGTIPSSKPTHGDIRHGFVYDRVPHITLKSIASNTEIEIIWDRWEQILKPLKESLEAALEKSWQEWAIPRDSDEKWPAAAKKVHSQWWEARIARQKEMDASIAAKAEFEFLYDKPYEDKKKVRVAGPFTVESLSPHRVLGVDENDELIDPLEKAAADTAEAQTFPQMIIENLRTAGVQQAHKEDKIVFTSLTPRPGYYVCAEGRYREGNTDSGAEKRAAIFIGPEFGTVSRPDLVAAAREAGDADFDVLIACAFSYDAHATEFSKLGRIPVLKARMNADLHMAHDLKNTGKGNLFVIFGEPDIKILPAENGDIQVKVFGVDVFDPTTGEVRSDSADGIACWFIDTDYNEESFFVRHAYFLGANDPYSALKTTLKAEIDEEAWTTLHSDTSRPFPKPKAGRIAVKVINHLGDEVMKVFRAE